MAIQDFSDEKDSGVGSEQHWEKCLMRKRNCDRLEKLETIDIIKEEYFTDILKDLLLTNNLESIKWYGYKSFTRLHQLSFIKTRIFSGRHAKWFYLGNKCKSEMDIKNAIKNYKIAFLEGNVYAAKALLKLYDEGYEVVNSKKELAFILGMTLDYNLFQEYYQKDSENAYMLLWKALFELREIINNPYKFSYSNKNKVHSIPSLLNFSYDVETIKENLFTNSLIVHNDYYYDMFYEQARSKEFKKDYIRYDRDLIRVLNILNKNPCTNFVCEIILSFALKEEYKLFQFITKENLKMYIETLISIKQDSYFYENIVEQTPFEIPSYYYMEVRKFVQGDTVPLKTDTWNDVLKWNFEISTALKFEDLFNEDNEIELRQEYSCGTENISGGLI